MNISESDFAALSQRMALNRGDAPAVAKAKPPKPRQNKWEEAYDAELRLSWGRSEIQWYGFEPIKLRLASGTYYTPDFAVVDETGLHFVEVKGFWRDDALVKFKVAAEQFPFPFRAYRKRRVSEGGGWELVKYINSKGARP
jgi:hypothetical protein